jgi:hypothetical protein
MKKRNKAKRELEATDVDVDVENNVSTCWHLQVEAVANVNTPGSLIGGTVLHTPPLEPAVQPTCTTST